MSLRLQWICSDGLIVMFNVGSRLLGLYRSRVNWSGRRVCTTEMKLNSQTNGLSDQAHPRTIWICDYADGLFALQVLSSELGKHQILEKCMCLQDWLWLGWNSYISCRSLNFIKKINGCESQLEVPSTFLTPLGVIFLKTPNKSEKPKKLDQIPRYTVLLVSNSFTLYWRQAWRALRIHICISSFIADFSSIVANPIQERKLIRRKSRTLCCLFPLW